MFGIGYRNWYIVSRIFPKDTEPSYMKIERRYGVSVASWTGDRGKASEFMCKGTAQKFIEEHIFSENQSSCQIELKENRNDG
jgi:hypothetical protein